MPRGKEEKLRVEMMRLVTLNVNVQCEGIDYVMDKGEPSFLNSLKSGDIVQLWDWSNNRHEKWVVSNGELSPLGDQDQGVQCECTECHYRRQATPGDGCIMHGMKGMCKGTMNPIEE